MRKIRESLASLVVIGISLCFSAANVSGQMTINQIIENVRQNEKLFDDIEVLMHETYNFADGKAEIESDPSELQTIVESTAKTRFVSQGSWFRMERECTDTANGKRVSNDRVRAFDGETTRVREQQWVGNLYSKRVEDEFFIRPHMFLIRHMNFPFPFSTYLSGPEAIAAYPNAVWRKELRQEAEYLGEEQIEGFNCHKVRVKVFIAQTGIAHDGREFWLAEERNYLPIKQLAYTYRYSDQIPVGTGVVKEFTEVSHGVWFPSEIEYISYNKELLRDKSLLELQWKRRYVVDSVSLDPQYDRNFFLKLNSRTERQSTK